MEGRLIGAPADIPYPIFISGHGVFTRTIATVWLNLHRLDGRGMRKTVFPVNVSSEKFLFGSGLFISSDWTDSHEVRTL